jgi:predicted esterase
MRQQLIRGAVLSSLLRSSASLSTSSASSRQHMQTIRSDGLGGRGITLTPHSGSYSNILIFLHGLGDTADGWASMMPALGVKDTKFILPTADSRPIALNGGVSMPGWTNVYGLEYSSPEDKEGFTHTYNRIDKIVQAEIDKGMNPKKIIVGGFSQGGASALHYSLRSPHSLGGCIALSSWLPLRSEYPGVLSPAAATMPILQVHGTEDYVVNYQWGEMSFKLIQTLLPSSEPKFMTIEVS